MRTIMIANNIATNKVFNEIGEIGFIAPNGTADLSAYSYKKGEVLQVLNNLTASVGLGDDASWKQFRINPLRFDYHYTQNGTNTADKSVITYPTGNYGLVEPFTGGIVIKQHDKDKNVFKTLKLKEFETSLTAWSDIKAAIVAALNTLTAYITRVSDTEYTHVLDNITVEFVGSLNVLRCKKVFGEKALITGEDVARLELEFSPNSGGGQFLQENYSYSDVNFIANKATNYDMISITTQMPSERALLPQSEGFEVTLLIAVPVARRSAVATPILNFLKALKNDPTGELVTETENV